LEKKSWGSKDSKDWSFDKQKKVHTDEKKALEGIPESVKIDRYKVRICP
jgi:hypothetical protein